MHLPLGHHPSEKAKCEIEPQEMTRNLDLHHATKIAGFTSWTSVPTQNPPLRRPFHGLAVASAMPSAAIMLAATGS